MPGFLLAGVLATVLSRNSVGRSRVLACPEGCSTCSLVPFAYHCLGCSMLLVSRCWLVASSITCEAASLDTCPPSVVHWTSNYWQKMLVAFSLLLRAIHHSKSVFKFFFQEMFLFTYIVWYWNPLWCGGQYYHGEKTNTSITLALGVCVCVRVRACVCVQVNSSVHMCNMYPIWRAMCIITMLFDCCRFYTSEMVVAIDSIH